MSPWIAYNDTIVQPAGIVLAVASHWCRRTNMQMSRVTQLSLGFALGMMLANVTFAQNVKTGTSSKTLSDNPQKNADNLNKAVVKMFKNVPPAAKKAD